MRLARLSLLTLALACNGDGGTDTQTPTDGETGTTPTGTTPTTGTGDDRVDAILLLSADLAAGETVYTNNCSACHGADGMGTLSGADLMARVPGIGLQGVVETVLRGEGNMDSYKFLSNQQVADVAGYVVDAFGSGM